MYKGFLFYITVLFRNTSAIFQKTIDNVVYSHRAMKTSMFPTFRTEKFPWLSSILFDEFNKYKKIYNTLQLKN